MPMPNSSSVCAKPSNGSARFWASYCERLGANSRQSPPNNPKSIEYLRTLLERAERLRNQRPKDKNKLYALHAPEVECIGKGKARKPYEFGVKASIAVTHRSGLIVGARTFPNNPYDGHILSAQLEQSRILLEDINIQPKQVFVDLGFRKAEEDNPEVEILHRGKYKSLSAPQRRWLKRRQAVEPAIGHLKSDHRMDRCWLRGQQGDALHAVLCAAGYNLRWLMRAMVRLGLKAFLFVLNFWCRYFICQAQHRTQGAQRLSVTAG